MALTASDGTGLALTKMAARAVVEAPLAFTELRLTFENPQARTLEGNFTITLPPGATVSRFAMKVDNSWQEGEVVELQRARRAYEDFLHRRQDPALLEQGAGNEFQARVFPIPAGGVKELIVSYSEELDESDSYAVRLRGLPEVGQLDLAVNVPGIAAPVQELHLSQKAPSVDFVLDPKFVARRTGLRSGNLVLARVKPTTDSHPDPLDSVFVLIDTSASRALGFDEEVSLLGELVQKIVQTSGQEAQLSVACFDQVVEPIFAGDAGGFGQAELRAIRERHAFGASNLEQALGFVSRAKAARRVILLTDGVATAGASEVGTLGAAMQKLKAAGVERVDAISLGGIRDEALLHHLVTTALPHAGVVANGAAGIAAIAHRLTESTRSGVAIAVDGATWSWPKSVDGVQAGDEVLVYAEVPSERPVRIAVGGAPATSLELTRVEKPLLERALVKAKIASLVASQDTRAPSADVQKQIVDLSVSHRVLSPYTAMLVLETESDYERFALNRKALTDILTVDSGRLSVRRRAGEVPVRKNGNASPPLPTDFPKGFGAGAAPTAPDDAASATGSMWGAALSDSFGAGGLGLSGAGEGGSGDGRTPAGLGRLGAAPSTGDASTPRESIGHGQAGTLPRPRAQHHTVGPSLRAAQVQISGRIPAEIIQRIVRMHFGRFRQCYENGLRMGPGITGRVVVRFQIDRTGAAVNPSDAGSTLPDSAAVSCVVRAFGDLSFPQPDGGPVTVVYPIDFNPGGQAEAPAAIGQPGPAPSPNVDPYTGTFKTVMSALERGENKTALQTALDWHDDAPGDVMALIALGQSFEALGEIPAAARAYGSIIDLFSSRADLRRFAGTRLEHLRGGAGLDLALDTYAKAAAQRADHPASHRLLAFALLKKGDPEKAFNAALVGIHQSYPPGRFAGVMRILKEDLGLIAAAWVKAEPLRGGEIARRLSDAGGTVEDAPSLRFVLNWETDANDVDFHIHDSNGGHAFYRQPNLPSGGSLYADVTTGYGPECFTIRGAKAARPSWYRLQAHYYSRGPMGYGMGNLEVLEHDGKGGITFDERPFVAMVDQAFIDLGTITR